MDFQLIEPARKKLGLTQEELAMLIGVSSKYISALENGKRKQASAHVTQKLKDFVKSPPTKKKVKALKTRVAHEADYHKALDEVTFSSQELVSEQLNTIPDGTGTHILTTTHILEANDHQTLEELYQSLLKNKKTEHHYYIPRLKLWESAAEETPEYSSGPRQVQRTFLRMLKKLEEKTPAVSNLHQRVQLHEVDSLLCFHPTFKIIIRHYPDERDIKGYIEMDIGQQTTLPAFMEIPKSKISPIWWHISELIQK